MPMLSPTTAISRANEAVVVNSSPTQRYHGLRMKEALHRGAACVLCLESLLRRWMAPLLFDTPWPRRDGARFHVEHEVPLHRHPRRRRRYAAVAAVAPEPAQA